MAEKALQKERCPALKWENVAEPSQTHFHPGADGFVLDTRGCGEQHAWPQALLPPSNHCTPRARGQLSFPEMP